MVFLNSIRRFTFQCTLHCALSATHIPTTSALFLAKIMIIDTISLCRLEEMQAYCESKGECRRKMFHEKFGYSGQPFRSCGNMCDNCRGQKTLFD